MDKFKREEVMKRFKGKKVRGLYEKTEGIEGKTHVVIKPRKGSKAEF